MPPGKRPFARWHAQAQPGTLGLMLANAPGTQRATDVILHRAHKGPHLCYEYMAHITDASTHVALIHPDDGVIYVGSTRTTMAERDATHKRSFAEHIRNSGCKSSPLTRFVASKGPAYADHAGITD